MTNAVRLSPKSASASLRDELSSLSLNRCWIVLEEHQWESILAKVWTVEIQEAIRDQIRVCVQAERKWELNAKKPVVLSKSVNRRKREATNV